jgi:hypothetical protein
MKRGGLVLLGLLLAAACGSSNKSHPADAEPDTPEKHDAMIDGGGSATTFTSFVINLVVNVTADSAPAAFSTFATLPDPDGTDNNTSAYASLF